MRPNGQDKLPSEKLSISSKDFFIVSTGAPIISAKLATESAILIAPASSARR